MVLAWLHLVALVIGSAALWGRARALHQAFRETDGRPAVRRALVADLWWGIAAVAWLVTGLWRLLAGTEKNTAYYLQNHAFLAKMAMFVAVVVLEIWPMMTLMRWRTRRRDPTPRDAGRIEAISYVQLALVFGIVFAAVSMARGYGTPSATRASGKSAVADTLRGLGDPRDSTPASASDTASAATTRIDPMPPSGSEEPTAADLALLAREIAMPITGIDVMKLHSNFDELRGGTRRHEAFDIMSPRRTPVHAATSGRVLRLFNSKAGGLMVYAADSTERFILMYAHLDGYAPGLRDGARIQRGETIGYVGSTGNASANAPHLHFAIARSADVKHWSTGTPVDPFPVLQAAERSARADRP